MNICLIGYGIPSLVLANILANRNIKVSIFDETKLTNKSNTRTLGIAKKNIEFLKREKINCKIITPEFKDFKNGKYKMISFFAKKARGMMARYSIENNILDSNELKNFDYEGYSHNSELSNGDNWVFCRG